MPQERPRHEPLKPEGYKTFEDSYKESEKRLKGHGIVNADPPKREKPKPRPSAEVIEQLQGHLRASNNELKTLVQDFAGAPENDALRAELHRYRGDLAGAFNDGKLALAAKLPREPGPGMETALRKMLDWMQFAEDKGKLADCLDQWNDAVRANDWERMALLSEAIKQGIEYDKAVLKEWFDSLTDRLQKDSDVARSREQMLALLDGIGFEVSRSADTALFGSFDPGRLMVAAQEALARACDRQVRAREIADSVASLDASRFIDVGKVGSLYEYLSSARTAVRNWESAAHDVSKVATAIANGVDPGTRRQIEVAARLDGLEDLSKAMLAVLEAEPAGTATSSTLTVWAKDDLVFTLRELASAMVQTHRNLASHLTEPAAQAALLKGKGIQALQDAIAKADANRKAANTLYEQALAATGKGALREYWKTNRDGLYEHLGRLSKSQDRKVAGWAETVTGELKNLFVDDLGPTLDKWNERKDDDIYGLAWQLIDTLRAYKAGAERLLAGAPSSGGASYQYVRDYTRQVLDAVLGAVAKGLADDVAAGRV